VLFTEWAEDFSKAVGSEGMVGQVLKTLSPFLEVLPVE
jgi:hypothetical protein